MAIRKNIGENKFLAALVRLKFVIISRKTLTIERSI